MLRTVQYSLKQLIVSVLQQLIEVWHVRWTEAASLAVAEKVAHTQSRASVTEQYTPVLAKSSGALKMGR